MTNLLLLEGLLQCLRFILLLRFLSLRQLEEEVEEGLDKVDGLRISYGLLQLNRTHFKERLRDLQVSRKDFVWRGSTSAFLDGSLLDLLDENAKQVASR